MRSIGCHGIGIHSGQLLPVLRTLPSEGASFNIHVHPDSVSLKIGQTFSQQDTHEHLKVSSVLRRGRPPR